MLGVSSGGGGGGAGGSLLQSLRGAAASGGAAAASPAPAATAGGRAAGTAAAGGTPRPPARPTATSGGTGGKPANQGKIQLADLRNILGAVQPLAEVPETVPVEWPPALTRNLLLPILSNPAFVERLTPHLPQDPLIPHTAQEVMSTIQSPQFQQAIQAFTTAFESRQLGPLIQEFNLGPEAVQAAQNGDFKAFVKALQSAGSATGAGPAPGAPTEKPGNDDDEMSVD